MRVVRIKHIKFFFIPMSITRYFFTIFLALTATLAVSQTFHNLTADEVKIDSVVPVVHYSLPLPENSQDSLSRLSLYYRDSLSGVG